MIQGGSLSTLLSNIYLNGLDKELERRQLHFARYADGCVIFVKTESSAERVMKNIVTFIETKLKLKVNASKTHITRPSNLKYLGFSFWKSADGWKAKPHDESFVKLFRKLKMLLRRSWSVENDYRIEKINQVLRGWINYYRRSSMKKKIARLGKWLRNAMRVVIWKQWKVSRKRIELTSIYEKLLIIFPLGIYVTMKSTLLFTFTEKGRINGLSCFCFFPSVR